MKIDMNADMGESFGPWRMGNDQALLDHVTSANIACGFHAGDPDVMARTMRMAAQNGVGIGAHPGFHDLQGFGRRRMRLSSDEMGNMVAYQLGAARGIAAAAGAQVRHLKLHGALSNMASEDAGIARACFDAALRVDPDLILVALAGTAMEAAARDLGARVAAEIFADRAYEDDASLVDRSKPGAVLHDPVAAAERVIAMLRDKAIHSIGGKRIPCRIDTVCIHGDGPEAVPFARQLRRELAAADIQLRMFD
ncbi:LamB/YcsF family protein [Paracoccus stylophorae]|uniref:5-oxoprolinase subunit A n=1 Tax=Paracoccus stylophorae TaxID=659350 RepID=A0ABY7SZ37_9RHOB|nr:5-oxoprolinase subunit PxpA [Paracoccus stylophorae]WCR11197.1 LamB/YcsF family protein [Paracoccus stylophorae]